MKNVGGTQGVCPYCGDENVIYDTICDSGHEIYYPASCEYCEREWKEFYDIEFSGNYAEEDKMKDLKKFFGVETDED